MYSNKKEENIKIFEDTIRMINGSERLLLAVENSIQNTVIYQPDSRSAERADRRHMTVTVTNERSLEAAARLSKKHEGKRIAVLNFASATNAGGGVTKGSSAQEEALCRCSTLYPCLNTDCLKEKFYQVNRARHSALYSDACIYTPDIFMIKSDTSSPKRLPEDKWISIDIITCAAPNLRAQPSNHMNPNAGDPVKLSDSELLELHIKRGRNIMNTAALNNADVLVLGAFGCGAFRNDPKIVSRAYKKLCTEFGGYFDEICFAVYCPPDDQRNFNTFKATLSGMRT